MSYVKCHDCGTTVHFRPKNVTEFHQRYVEGDEPIYCLSCFKKKEERKEKEEN